MYEPIFHIFGNGKYIFMSDTYVPHFFGNGKYIFMSDTYVPHFFGNE